MQSIAIIAIVLIAAIIGGFYYSTTMTPAAPQTIKLGGVAPLSPPGAYASGAEMKMAFDMAVNEINAQGGVLGKKIETVFEDTAGTPEKGKAAFEKLISQDKVVAIVGEFHSSVTLAEIPVTNASKIPFIVVAAWSDKITAAGSKYVFRDGFTNSLLYRKYADFIKDAGFKNIAVIGEDTDFGIGAAAVLVARLTEIGLTASSTILPMTTTDFVPMLTRLKASTPRPDLIVEVFTGAGNYIMIKQAYEIGLAPTKQTMFADPNDEYLSKEFWSTIGAGGQYVIGYNVFSAKAKVSDVGKKFMDNFNKTYNRAATSVTFGMYDAVYLMVDAIKRAGSTDGDKIADALESSNWNGASGTITFALGPKQGLPDYLWHQWADVPLYVLQYTTVNQSPDDAEIIWPLNLATATMAVPPA